MDTKMKETERVRIEAGMKVGKIFIDGNGNLHWIEETKDGKIIFKD